MTGYVLKRLLLIIPTLFGIMLVNFIIIQAAPGGPVQQILAKIRGESSDVENRFGGGGQDFGFDSTASYESSYRGVQGIDPAFIKDLERQFGFDKPAYQRFFIMIGNYLTFDFGKSYFRDEKVVSLVCSKVPVSASLGLWTTLLVYCISIPLGIAKAVRDGSRFDVITSGVVIIAYAIPSFLFALFLIIMFAGGSFWSLFPLRGLTSDNWQSLSLFGKAVDYLWHLALPIFAMVIAGFAKLTLLTKNSFLEEISKQYIVTARAKGLSQKRVLYGHIFRNALLVVIAGFPAAFIHILFTSSLLIEVLFSLDGLGLLGFEAAMSRDYPVMFGTLYMFTLLGMVLHLIGDLLYMAVDRRIDLTAARG
ncbi:microcin C ABC transporter permease YejB [Candidatus Finniella inopinata]|uniref:Microcin C ABC transporter permease YejB n=1 Tax=Candidatus Finniella inopinata TaxID=1696036 RepID=A0A4Q7DGC9_9PROT|nr:microcin C ABC transporter permease YejB [Candidatus Finniella inopinata]RZI45712.1 microcin C ABC transporter permease YejB [Candidatus Finniella inopinata]